MGNVRLPLSSVDLLSNQRHLDGLQGPARLKEARQRSQLPGGALFSLYAMDTCSGPHSAVSLRTWKVIWRE
jgi:hypothetical protein